jgi:hypothetical protein
MTKLGLLQRWLDLGMRLAAVNPGRYAQMIDDVEGVVELQEVFARAEARANPGAVRGGRRVLS